MNGADDYLSRAVEAEAKADKATGAYRSQMLALAAQWRDLARQARLLNEFEKGIEQERREARAETSGASSVDGDGPSSGAGRAPGAPAR